MVKFASTKEEFDLIEKIAERASGMGLIGRGTHYSIETFMMDLDATNSNGCPVDFDKMLVAPQFDFTHDVAGIYRHIDRETGELRDCFVPRCSR